MDPATMGSLFAMGVIYVFGIIGECLSNKTK